MFLPCIILHTPGGLGTKAFSLGLELVLVPLSIFHESAVFVSSNGSRTLQQAQNHSTLLFFNPTLLWLSPHK